MLADSLVMRAAPPRRVFSMRDTKIYERNYERLLQLLPELHSIVGSVSVEGRDTLELRVSLLERCRYTTTLVLTHHLGETGSWVVDPQMKIRLYHDARVAEVIVCQGLIKFWPHHQDGFRVLAIYCGEKHRINVFLAEWLTYCLQQGYRVSCAVPTSDL